MKTLQEYLAEERAARKPFVSRFPDTLSGIRSPEHMDVIRSGMWAYVSGQDLNKKILARGAADIPAEAGRDAPAVRSMRGINRIFDPKQPSGSITHPQVTYHGTRHNVEFDHNFETTIIPVTSTTPNLEAAVSHAVLARDGKRPPADEHHVLRIHWDPVKNKNVPLVPIARFSPYAKEEELLMPIGTRFRQLNYTTHMEAHPETGKRVIIHDVEPIEANAGHDPTYEHETEEAALRILRLGGRWTSPMWVKWYVKHIKAHPEDRIAGH